jgi:FixJ family two-component response regulator
MPEMTGIEMYEAMESSGCNLPIIFLTGQGGVSDSVLAMKHGAVNFLTKPATREDLLAALEEAFGIQDARAREDSQDAEYSRRFVSLTPREKEVCLKVIQGMMNKEIAGDLGTSEKTIKIHRSRVMTKMQAGSVPQLVRMVDRVQSRSHWKTPTISSSAH